MEETPIDPSPDPHQDPASELGALAGRSLCAPTALQSMDALGISRADRHLSTALLIRSFFRPGGGEEDDAADDEEAEAATTEAELAPTAFIQLSHLRRSA